MPVARNRMLPVKSTGQHSPGRSALGGVHTWHDRVRDRRAVLDQCDVRIVAAMVQERTYSPTGLLAEAPGRVAALLLRPAPRVATQSLALPALRRLARLALLGSHGRQHSDPASLLMPGQAGCAWYEGGHLVPRSTRDLTPSFARAGSLRC